MTVALTVLSGVAIFVVGQIILKLVIEPVHQLKKTIADIAHTFIKDANILQNSHITNFEQRTEVCQKLRVLSGQLYADMSLIPCYRLLGKLFSLPSKVKVYEAAQNLIAITNWIGISNSESNNNSRNLMHIIKNIQDACDNLNIFIAPKDRISDDLLR